MIQRISNGKQIAGGWNWREYRKCHFCRKTITKGEEYVGFGDDNRKSMHRTCLDNWLRSHPPKKDGAAKKVMSDEEAEKEFEKLRRALLQATKPTPKKRPAAKKPRSKTTS